MKLPITHSNTTRAAIRDTLAAVGVMKSRGRAVMLAERLDSFDRGRRPAGQGGVPGAYYSMGHQRGGRSRDRRPAHGAKATTRVPFRRTEATFTQAVATEADRRHNRQKRPRVPRTAPGWRPRSHQLRRQAVLSGLRSPTVGCSPSTVHPAPGTLPSAARSAMSSLFRCAAGITERYTDVATKPRGGAIR